MKVLGIAVCITLIWVGAMGAVIAFPIFLLTQRGRDLLRLLDHVVNVAWFGGNWYASLSAQSWQYRRAWLVKSLDVVEPGHCEGAFRREADVIDFMGRR